MNHTKAIAKITVIMQPRQTKAAIISWHSYSGTSVVVGVLIFLVDVFPRNLKPSIFVVVKNILHVMEIILIRAISDVQFIYIHL